MDLPMMLLRRYAINSSRVHLEQLNRKFAEKVPPGALVLDAAAGEQPYRHIFSHAVYEAADFEMVDKPYAKSTYVCDLTEIPVENGRFDFIVFNQGLEHMPDPLKVLKELNRVLKAGGSMIITAPLFYEEHEVPYDFFRYTQFGYRMLLPKSGFEVSSIDWVEGYVGTVAYQFRCAAKYLPKTIGYYPLRLALAMLAILLYRLDIKHRHTESGYPKNYAVIAVKPAEHETPALQAA